MQIFEYYNDNVSQKIDDPSFFYSFPPTTHLSDFIPILKK
ncbi:hypothetical protein HMPREF1116_0018 [Streptococcus sp. SK140]|nr:hypothetical protein HMPREF1116_0018 [Streptococcus sp. SK140]